MANFTSRGQQRDKPFRDALRMEAALAEQGQKSPAKKGSLRHIARKLLERGATETAAAKEVADRLDGRVPLSHEHGGVGGGPIQTLDLSRATNDQLDALEALIGPVAGAADGDTAGDLGGEGASSR